MHIYCTQQLFVCLCFVSLFVSFTSQLYLCIWFVLQYVEEAIRVYFSSLFSLGMHCVHSHTHTEHFTLHANMNLGYVKVLFLRYSKGKLLFFSISHCLSAAVFLSTFEQFRFSCLLNKWIFEIPINCKICKSNVINSCMHMKYAAITKQQKYAEPNEMH